MNEIGDHLILFFGCKSGLPDLLFAKGPNLVQKRAKY